MLLMIVAVILFVIADLLIRLIIRRTREKKIRAERESALHTSLRLDFSEEAVSLKRAEVEDPKARILCVDDEAVVLDSFRKILVMDGYSVDTVLSGPEALSLVRLHHYDFVFTDLKMPGFDGVEVTKAVKHLRPDIDVIIITGFATVQTAVDCMKFGAMDYVEKPFTEDELLDFVRKLLIKRKDRIQKLLKPRVHITHFSGGEENVDDGEFSIPGGVFISPGHCWISVEQDGTVKTGIDDFAIKLVGHVDDIEMPNPGMPVKKGQLLFTVRKGDRNLPMYSPISGRVARVNQDLAGHTEALDVTPYDANWICALDAENLHAELQDLKIGKAAVAFYQDEIRMYRESARKATRKLAGAVEETDNGGSMHVGDLAALDDKSWKKLVDRFFNRLV